jgi:Holliday junction resolvase-like predicted endonuclease
MERVMGLALDRGRAGEALAAAYVEMLGCRLVARNARLAGVEVDIVADDGGAVATVDRRKRQRLMRAARALEQQGITHVRIDVIAVDLAPDGVTLTHYRNAVTD